MSLLIPLLLCPSYTAVEKSWSLSVFWLCSHHYLQLYKSVLVLARLVYEATCLRTCMAREGWVWGAVIRWCDTGQYPYPMNPWGISFSYICTVSTKQDTTTFALISISEGHSCGTPKGWRWKMTSIFQCKTVMKNYFVLVCFFFFIISGEFQKMSQRLQVKIFGVSGLNQPTKLWSSSLDNKPKCSSVTAVIWTLESKCWHGVWKMFETEPDSKGLLMQHSATRKSIFPRLVFLTSSLNAS